MRILFYCGKDQNEAWIRGFAERLPAAEAIIWSAGTDIAPCDYAVVWDPPPAMLPDLARVKAVFLTGAGADIVLNYRGQLRNIPIVRLGDAGMGRQMAEYVTYAVLRYFRRFDLYENQAQELNWERLRPHRVEDFTVGILGAGILGQRVIETIRPFGFPLRSWSRTRKNMPGVKSFLGNEDLEAFLRDTRVLVCLLPLTRETEGLLDAAALGLLPRAAFVINVSRGAIFSQDALLSHLESGHIEAATLDVFAEEPLPHNDPLWKTPRVTITPHIAALTLRRESTLQIVEKIADLERGVSIKDVVDPLSGY